MKASVLLKVLFLGPSWVTWCHLLLGYAFVQKRLRQGPGKKAVSRLGRKGLFKLTWGAQK